MKRCANCEEKKDREEFGKDSLRADGLNIYCKICTREKTAQHRANLKAMGRPLNGPPAVAGRKSNAIARVRRFGPQAQKVYEAIRAGARTHREIAMMTKLASDDVGEAIADLLLWQKAIGTKLEGEARRYFIRAA